LERTNSSILFVGGLHVNCLKSFYCNLKQIAYRRALDNLEYLGFAKPAASCLKLICPFSTHILLHNARHNSTYRLLGSDNTPVEQKVPGVLTQMIFVPLSFANFTITGTFLG
jgi:hypothetical protein